MRWSILLLAVSISPGCESDRPAAVPITDVSFSPDGKWLVACGGRLNTRKPRVGGEGFVKIWDTEGWKLRDTINDGFTDPVEQLFFAHDGLLCSVSNNIIPDSPGSPYGGVSFRYWNITKREETPPFRLTEGSNQARVVAYCPERKLVCLSSGGKPQIVKMPGLEVTSAMEGHSQGSLLMRFSPDCKRLMSCTVDKPFLRVHDAASGKRVAEHSLDSVAPKLSLVSGGFSRDGTMVFVCTESKKLFVLPADLTSVLLEVKLGLFPRCADFSPDGGSIAIPKSHDTLQILSIRKGEVLREFGGITEGVNGCAFSTDGRLVAVASGGHPQGADNSPGKVRVFEAKTGKLVAELD